MRMPRTHLKFQPVQIHMQHLHCIKLVCHITPETPESHLASLLYFNTWQPSPTPMFFFFSISLHMKIPRGGWFLFSAWLSMQLFLPRRGLTKKSFQSQTRMKNAAMLQAECSLKALVRLTTSTMCQNGLLFSRAWNTTFQQMSGFNAKNWNLIVRIRYVYLHASMYMYQCVW